MNVEETKALMMNSSNSHPYKGKLSKEDNVLAAIELAELVLQFSENGQSDEAMDLSPDHMKTVITELKSK